MTWSADEPYNDLPPLPPTAEVETRDVLKATIEARAALSALDQAARRIANPTVLINAIPLLEAQASSEIENIVTTTDELFRYAHDEGAATSSATKETLHCRSALFAGVRLIQSRPLSVTTAAEVCATVKDREMPIRRLPGTFVGNPVTKAAIYTPPVGEARIREKLGDWEQFIHARDGFDPLVVMALAHYQFEAIHPFEDGNGRTGRILNVLLLMSAGLIAQPILYLSRYIIENKDEYYRLLLAVTRDGAWTEWVLFLVEGIRQTATSTVVKIDQIQTLQDRTLGTIRQTTGGANADLLAVLFEQPYCRIASVIERCGVSRPTATNWLNGLVATGVLLDVRRGRERIFINTALLDLLTRSDSIVVAETEPTLLLVSDDAERAAPERQIGVGSWPGGRDAWPTDDRYDPELLEHGDTRNVVDAYRYWSMDAIVADLDTRRRGFHVAIENWQHDMNIGSIVRTANAFLAAEVHIVGHRRWNRRGAMVTDRYQHIREHPHVAALVAWAREQGLPIVAVDNVEGSVDVRDADIPERCVLLFGQEGPGLTAEALAAADVVVEIAQAGSTRSINAGAAAAIVMHEWLRRHGPR